MSKSYWVYIVTNRARTVLYTGVTSDLEGRIWDHRNGTSPKSFTARYYAHLLVWFELMPTAREAIAAEKIIKGWVRRKKVEMINKFNPEWKDLSEGWFG